MAFELNDLVEKLKAKGLPIAEDLAGEVVNAVFEWIEEEVVESENKYDDLALAILPAVKPFIFKYIDKIDGQEG